MLHRTEAYVLVNSAVDPVVLQCKSEKPRCSNLCRVAPGISSDFVRKGHEIARKYLMPSCWKIRRNGSSEGLKLKGIRKR